MQPSDPDYGEVNRLQTLLCLLVNVHMVFGYVPSEMPSVERAYLIEQIQIDLKELLDFDCLPFNRALTTILK